MIHPSFPAPHCNVLFQGLMPNGIQANLALTQSPKLLMIAYSHRPKHTPTTNPKHQEDALATLQLPSFVYTKSQPQKKTLQNTIQLSSITVMQPAIGAHIKKFSVPFIVFIKKRQKCYQIHLQKLMKT